VSMLGFSRQRGARRGFIGEDLAVADVHDAMRVFGNVLLVGDEDDGVALAVEDRRRGP